MTNIREKAQARTKQIVGQMVGDELLVEEGKEQERRAEASDTQDSAARGARPATNRRDT